MIQCLVENKMTKLKSHSKKIATNFHGKTPLEGFEWLCLSAIVIDFVFKLVNNHYPQALLEECKYKVKEKELTSLIKDNLESSSSDDSEEEDFEEIFQ